MSDNFTTSTVTEIQNVILANKAVQQRILLFTKFNFYTHTIMLFFGIPGNILCILTIRQKSLSKMARTSISITLAIVDSLYLIVQYTRTVYNHLHKDTILNISNIICKFSDFSYLFCTHMDAWMIVLMSIERLVAVYKPYTVKRIFTPLKIKCVVISFVVFFILLDLEMCFR